jgi:hypothetical protein
LLEQSKAADPKEPAIGFSCGSPLFQIESFHISPGEVKRNPQKKAPGGIGKSSVGQPIREILSVLFFWRSTLARFG